jgi:hypothetical protein
MRKLEFAFFLPFKMTHLFNVKKTSWQKKYVANAGTRDWSTVSDDFIEVPVE